MNQLKRIRREGGNITGFYKKNKGSMTLETALVLPLFLFAILSLYSVVTMFRFYTALQQQMTETGEQIAVYAMAADVTGSDLAGGILADGYANRNVLSHFSSDELKLAGVVDGADGINSLLYSRILTNEDDLVDLVFHYQIKPRCNVFQYSGFSLTNRCRLHAWTGYAGTDSESQTERIVYVTENGTVYHLTTSCTHLDLSITPVEYSSLSGRRNYGGSRYRECELCGYQGQDTVFITNEGDRYHSSLSCSGLRRTVRSIPISQVGDMRACSRCGN